MKRTKIIMAFLLCACLIVGVGYAAISDVLDVDGTAEFGISSDFDGKVTFTEAYAYDSVSDNADLITTNTDKATFTVKSVANKGTTAFFRFQVKNSNATAATIYLSNAAISATITAADGSSTTENNNVYQVRYLFDTNKYSDANAIPVGTGAIVTEGSIAYNDAPVKTALAAGESRYMYVAVTFANDFTPPSDGSTITASFAMEFSVWTDGATVGA